MAETKARHIANLVEDDGDVKSAHLDNTTSATPTAVSDQANTSTGYLDLPAGTTNQRPGGSENSSVTPNAGNTRFNSTTGSLEFYDGTNWVSTNLIPVINSITGTIYAGASSTLTLSLSNTTDTIDVKYYEGGTLLATDSTITVSNNSATSTVPSQVHGQTGGDTISIQVVNDDGTPSSNNIDKTVLTLPSGSSPTTNGHTFSTISNGNYRVHTFTASGTFTNTINNLSVEYLVIGGGGGGGYRRAGGGGGGGYRCSVSNESSGGGNDAETALTMAGTSSGTAFEVSVGAGGPGSTSENPPGTDGQASYIKLQGAGTYLVRSEGGGGGASANHPTEGAASDGGCGGGAGSAWVSTSRSGGDGTNNQGYDGGDASGSGKTGGGGGGGAGNHGSTGGDNGGNGGPGVTSSINGTSTGRAGGGGGGTQNGSIGTGSDSGGNGGQGSTAATAGGDGEGGGGGGGGGDSSYDNGGDGGDGIVIIRYQLP